MDKPIIQVSAAGCPPEYEEEFNKWHDDTHLPMQFKFKGVSKVTRYRLKNVASFPSSAPPKAIEIDDWPVFLSIYEFDSQEDYEAYKKSPELAEAAAETKGRLQGGWLQVGIGKKWSAEYELIGTLER